MKTTNLIILRFSQIDWELIAIANKKIACQCFVFEHIFSSFFRGLHLHDNQQTKMLDNYCGTIISNNNFMAMEL